MSGPQESLLKDLVELVRENWDNTDGSWKQGEFVDNLIRPEARRDYCLNFSTHHFFCLQEVLETLKRLYDTRRADIQRELENIGREGILGNLSSSYNAVRRQLGFAASAYRRVRSMNQTRLRGLGRTSPLPKPSEMNKVIQKSKISIVSLEGYSAHATAIVANLMRQLFELRLEEEDSEEKIPKFLTVVEEAHNFVPSSMETHVPSMEILRQVATEGRKYGMGLVLISQRPSRAWMQPSYPNATPLLSSKSSTLPTKSTSAMWWRALERTMLNSYPIWQPERLLLQVSVFVSLS
jgi:hypothetical protein